MIYPIDNLDNSKSKEKVDIKCPDIGGFPTNERMSVKKMLSAYILGLSSRCYRAGLGLKIRKLVSTSFQKDETDMDSFIIEALDHVEDAIEILNRFVRDLDENSAVKIHEIEDKMDLLFYSFIRISAQNMVENLSRGVDARDIAKAYTQRNPGKNPRGSHRFHR